MYTRWLAGTGYKPDWCYISHGCYKTSDVGFIYDIAYILLIILHDNYIKRNMKYKHQMQTQFKVNA